MSRRDVAPLRLVLVTDRLRAARPPVEALALALPAFARAGVADRVAVLVRERDLDDDALAALVRQVLGMTGEFGIPVLVAGRPHVAASLGCGLHLGGRDGTPLEARAHVGDDALVTRALHLADADWTAADLAATDAVLASPVFPTRSKPDATPIGLDGLRALVLRTGLPTFALGGIDRPEQVADVLAAGARGVAVRHAILGVDDPAAAARRFAAALRSI